METAIFLVSEEQSDWHFNGESSVESIHNEPVKAFIRIEDAQQYIKDSNSSIMTIKTIPLVG